MRTPLLILALVVAAAGVYLYPALNRYVQVLGVNRKLSQLNTKNCKLLHPKEFQGCEDIRSFRHDNNQYLILACSHNITERAKLWFPALGHNNKNVTGTIRDNFFIYDIKQNTKTKLNVENFDTDLVVHGFDLVQKSEEELLLYSVNHRRTGSVIERFSYKIGTTSLKHKKTFNNQAVLWAPNSVTVIDHNTNTFYASNDHKNLAGIMRELETFTQRKWGHIAFHSDSTGFRIAHTDLIYPNGIVNRDNHLYVSSCTGGSVYVFTINKDFTITLQEEILLDYIIDNLSFTPDGNLLTAGHPEGLKFGPHAKTLSQAPSMVTKIMIEKTEPRFEHIFYDNTGLMNASTTGLQLKENGKDIMFITGVLSRGVLRCD